MGLYVDMGKARDIQRAHIREERNKKWPEVDAEWFKAMETQDQAAIEKAANKKRKLRNATKDDRLEQAQTEQELKALTLDELTKE